MGYEGRNATFVKGTHQNVIHSSRDQDEKVNQLAIFH